MDGSIIRDTIVSDVAVPAKLIIGDKEIDVTVVGHSYKETENHTHRGWLSSLDSINVEETFTCVKEFIKYI